MSLLIFIIYVPVFNYRILFSILSLKYKIRIDDETNHHFTFYITILYVSILCNQLIMVCFWYYNKLSGLNVLIVGCTGLWMILLLFNIYKKYFGQQQNESVTPGVLTDISLENLLLTTPSSPRQFQLQTNMLLMNLGEEHPEE